jgi:PAS domain S-box-containing protein
MGNRLFAWVDVVPDAVLAVRGDGSIGRANEVAEQLFGYGRGGLVGLSIEALISEASGDQHRGSWVEYLSSPSVVPMGSGRALRGLRSNGEEFPVEIAIGPTRDGTHVVAVVRDITSIVKTRDRLRDCEAESHQLLELLEDAPIGLCYLDKELRYLRVSKWLAKLNGIPVEEHLGRRIADVLPDVATGVESQLRHVLQTGEPIVDGLVETTTPAHPTTKRTYMHNYFPDRSADGAVVGISCVVQDVTAAKKDLEGALAEITKLKDRLQAENIYFQQEIKSAHDFDDIIGNSAVMRTTLYKLEQVAETDATVLLFGETGTGKELLARAIHSRSKRKMRPLIKVDCTTLPPGLMESELFGHQKGAFTGAHESKPGRFELADGGTIFLDEIGELPIELQAKLLRVIEEGEFTRLGSTQERKTNARVIAATNRDLKSEVSEGRFRADLYYRLGVFPIESPPLRDRREDIPLLVSFFVSKYADALGKGIRRIASSSMDALMAYDWPGNIRELRNVVERAVILGSGDVLRMEETLGDAVPPAGEPSGSLKRDLHVVERATILRALEESDWRVKGAGNAASRLGLSPSTLRSRMARLGIQRIERRQRAARPEARG